MPNDPTIKQSKLVIVEGNDEIRVFNSLFKHLNIQNLEFDTDAFLPLKDLLNIL